MKENIIYVVEALITAQEYQVVLWALYYAKEHPDATGYIGVD